MRKLFDIIIISIITSALVGSIVFAQPARTVTISSPTSGQTFTTLDSVTASGGATITGGDTNYEHYGVKVTWGDTPDLTTPCNPLASDYTWTTSPSNNHVYSATGSKTITAKLYHTCVTGSEPSPAEATQTVDIQILTPLCTLSAIPDLAFGPMNPGTTSGDGISTALHNTGNVNINTLQISGVNWQKTGGGTIPVGATKWALIDGQNYDDSVAMKALTTSGVSLGITPFAKDAYQDVFFKLRVPNDQSAGDYTQQITFTFGCD